MRTLGSLRLSDQRLLQADLFIASEWCAGRTDVLNPASGELLASVADATRQDVRHAITAAERAFREWSRGTAYERAAVLRAWHDLILANADDLATILTAEQGKPFAEARGEILYGATLRRMVRRRGKARLRGDGSHERALAPDRRPARADPRMRCDHAVELPLGDDLAKGRSRAGNGLHDGPETGQRDATVGARPRRASPIAPGSLGASSTSRTDRRSWSAAS